MLFALQRYEFFSKSQRFGSLPQKTARCCLPCKGTNFLANHNGDLKSKKGWFDVVCLAKVRIF